TDRIADAREAIPAAERAARAETEREAEQRRLLALARAGDALTEFDGAAAALAPIVEVLAQRMADTDRRANAVMHGLRGLISADAMAALHGQPAAVHVLARLVKLGTLPREML